LPFTCGRRISVPWLLPATVVALAAVIAGSSAVLYRVGALARLLGTGGFTSQIERQTPHAVAFERPRLWAGLSEGFLLGPLAEAGIMSAHIAIDGEPSAERDPQYPRPSEPYVSLADFANRWLPRMREVVADKQGHVAGRTARDVTYDFVFFGNGHGAPPAPSVPARGRSVFFEDRGYFYRLHYEAARDEFDRYLDVFERLVATFQFLD